MEQNQKVTTHQAASAVKSAAVEPIIFTSSEIKSGLWKALGCTKDGNASGSAELLMTLFVLNGDADKSLAAANEVVAAEADIRDGAKFYLTAAKPVTDKAGVMQVVAIRIGLPLTGAEVKAHSHSIVNLAKTARPFATFGKILEYSDKAKAVKGQKGSRTAGLIG